MSKPKSVGSKKTPSPGSAPPSPLAAFDFDVAFSFLDADRNLALSLETRLQPELNVFVYSTRQQVLAGTEGLESFRTVFNARSRLVVVLYRNGWGQTKFTRIEETAIRDRGFDEHWENFLLFVMLDDADPVPRWLPKHHIRLSYRTYGFDPLVGAIKFRAQSVGAEPRIETAVDKALRLAQEQEIRQERRTALEGGQGMGAAQAEASAVFDELEGQLSELSKRVPSLQLVWERDQIRHFGIRAKTTSMNIVPSWDHPLDRSVLQVFEFLGLIKFSKESGTYFPGPKSVNDSEYTVEFDRSCGGWCWRSGSGVMSSNEVAENIVKRLVELQADADSGHYRRDLNDCWPGR